jgi:hypothetical protein
MSQLQLENAGLRHHVRVLRRSVRRPELKDRDRAFLASASRALSRDRWASFMVTPQTLLRWHRELVRRKWTSRRRGPGRPLYGTKPWDPPRDQVLSSSSLDLFFGGHSGGPRPSTRARHLFREHCRATPAPMSRLRIAGGILSHHGNATVSGSRTSRTEPEGNPWSGPRSPKTHPSRIHTERGDLLLPRRTKRRFPRHQLPVRQRTRRCQIRTS